MKPPSTRHALSAMRTRTDEGSAAIEIVLVTPLLVILMLVAVFVGRLVDAHLRVDDAAHQAARAASLARTAAAAQADGAQAAAAALAAAGVSCRTQQTSIAGGGAAGGTVTATVTCVASLSDLSMIGVPGSVSVTASFTSPIDVYRSETP